MVRIEQSTVHSLPHTSIFPPEGWNIGQFSDNMKEFGLIFLCTLSGEQQGSCLNILFRRLKVGLLFHLVLYAYKHVS